MRKTLTIVFTICFMAVILQLCGCMKSETVKIGLLMDLTGRSSALGLVGRNSAQLAVDVYNENLKKGQRRVELIVKDNKGDDTIVEGLLKEFDQEGVRIILGPITSKVASGIMKSDYYKAGKILFISPTVSANEYAAIDDHFITLIDTNDKQGIVLAEKALSNKLETMAIIYDDSNTIYTIPTTTAFEEAFVKGGGIVTSKSSFTSSEHAPFDEIAKEIIDSNPDGVMIAASGVDAAQIAQNMHLRNPKIKIYTVLWAKSEDFIQNGGRAVEGAFQVATYDEQSPSVLAFKKMYKERFGSDSTFSGVHSYDGIKILLNAIESSVKWTPKDVKAFILEKNSFECLSGEVHINAWGDCDRPYVIIEIKEGQYVKAE